MSTPKIPAPIDAVVAAVNRGDTEAFLDAFAPDGLVNDWGSRYHGRSAIKVWSDREFVGARCQLTVTSVSTQGNQVSIMSDVISKGFNGPSRFTFEVQGGAVLEMRITAD